MFAQAVMFSPVIVANYYMVSNPDLARSIYSAMTPYGPNPWIDLAYLAIYATLVIAFAYFRRRNRFWSHHDDASRDACPHLSPRVDWWSLPRGNRGSGAVSKSP